MDGTVSIEPALQTAVPACRVDLHSVSKSYGVDEEKQEIVHDLSLEILPGQLTVIVGPSGCGKSTLVNMLAGFEPPTSGEILFDGRRIDGPSRERMVVFQESALIPWQTAYENVVFGPKLRGELKGKALEAEARKLLTKVGLQDFINKYPLQLSGGMQRRVELARALINQPRLLIMDEPFRGLDAMSRGLMQEFFLQLFEETRQTNVFVTSEIDEAIFLADRLVVLSNRPAQLRTIIEIALPRPRNWRMMSSPEAYDYKRHAMQILHEEAKRGFRQDAQKPA